MSQRSAILAKNVPVLVRGEHDGFYYRGTVKEEVEVSNSLCAVVMQVYTVSQICSPAGGPSTELR